MLIFYKKSLAFIVLSLPVKYHRYAVRSDLIARSAPVAGPSAFDKCPNRPWHLCNGDPIKENRVFGIIVELPNIHGWKEAVRSFEPQIF